MSSGWHKEDIKAAIRKRGVTMEALSLANGLHVNARTMALIRPSIHAERVIAEYLGVSPPPPVVAATIRSRRTPPRRLA